VASSTSVFAVRFGDAQSYYTSNARINSTNLVGDASSPFPIFPELIFPAGGKVSIDLQDLSAAENTIQIMFRGVKRYQVS